MPVNSDSFVDWRWVAIGALTLLCSVLGAFLMRALNQIDETRKALDSKVDKDDLHGQLQEIKNSIQENGRASERRQNDISRRIDDLMTTVVTGRPPARGNAS